MSGLLLRWIPERSHCDLIVTAGALDLSHELETMVNICLWTDRRADPSDRLPSGDDDPRGWWGDLYSPVRGDRIGSRLWLRVPGRAFAGIERTVRLDIIEALQPLIEDKIVSRVEAEVHFPNPLLKNRLDAIVDLYRGDQLALRLDYQRVWAEALAG